MGRRVATLRDADVMISGIHAPAEAAATDKTGFAELHEALVRNREARRDELRQVLSGPPWTKLQLYLTLWLRTLEEINTRSQGSGPGLEKTVQAWPPSPLSRLSAAP